MNTLIREAASSVEMGWLLGVMTVFFLAFFLGWTWWAYHPKNKERLEEAGRIPFNDGADA
jgi:cbb3-type cytochrome oxidase subunit 3